VEHFRETRLFGWTFPNKGVTKENDFLVCKKGKWAALELVNDHFHNSVVEEANRQSWFQKHHVQM
jgi:hypothetical protein